MPYFDVTKKYVGYRTVRVEADNLEEAREKAARTERYQKPSSHSLREDDPESWEVREITGRFISGVKVPDTASALELYSSMEGSEEAAKGIAEALVLACEKMGDDPTPKKVAKIAKEVLNPALDKYSDFGAYDTEPRWNTRNFLARVASKRSGIDRDSFADHLY